MSVLPVIGRELRAQARQPLTFWLRMVGGASALCAVGWAFKTTLSFRHLVSASPAFPGAGVGLPSPFQSFGAALFGNLNLFVFAAIWLFVPLACADAVSRERREGTLPLLYLTRLSSFGIVVGKTFVHLLRSLSLFLTMAPWLMLPVLFGGVELRDVRMAVLLDFAAVLLAMSAGLLASTFPRDWLKSVILAEVLAVALLLMMLQVHGAVLRHAVMAGTPAGLKPGTPAFWRSSWYYSGLFQGRSYAGLIQRTRRLIDLTTNASTAEMHYWGFGRPGIDLSWQWIWTGLNPAGHAAWLRGVLGIVAGAGLMLLGSVWLGAWRVARSWRDSPEQGAVSEVRRKLYAPRFALPFLNRRLSRSLTANPIGWLQIYSPSARLVKWAWCLFVILIEIIFSANAQDVYEAQAGLGLLLLLGLTFSATGSFREELETGAFELLLVTPLREWQIITGRLRGLWNQFLPAVLVYGAGTVYLASGWSDPEYSRSAWLTLGRSTIAFLVLPLIGLCFSVQRWNFFLAWMTASALGLLPATVGRAMGATEFSMILLQLGLGVAAALLLASRLKRRAFLLRRG